jgi:hypothetical protein
MDDLISEVDAALRRGDWSAVVMAGSSLYGMAAARGEWRLAEGIHDVVGMALFVLEHPECEQIPLFRQMSLSLAVVVSRRTKS